MWGLILKDFYTLSRYGKFFLLYLLVFCGVSVIQGDVTMISSLVVVLVTILSISTFSYDDYAKWDQFILSTPISRKRIVLAKYLLVLLLVLLGAALGLMITLLAAAFGMQKDGMMESLMALAASSFMGATMTGLIIPFIYRYGTEKSRLLMMLVFGIPALLLVGASQLGLEEGLSAMGGGLEGILMATPLFCLAIICFSYVASVKIYEKKEL